MKPRYKTLHSSEWNKTRLRKILKDMAESKILVVGDVGVDRYTTGVVERISPEAPVPIVRVESEVLKLGLAANVAENIHALGAEATLVGVVGADRSAQDMQQLLKKHHIRGAHLIEDATRRTVVKERIVSERQQLLRVDYEDCEPVSPAIAQKVLKQVEKMATSCDAMVVQDYAKGMLGQDVLQEIFAVARAAGRWVGLDPNARTPVGHYAGAEILTPNTSEAEKLSGIVIQDLNSLWGAGWNILHATHARHVVITRGKEGMAIFSAGVKDARLIPTYAKEVYDVSGAGDTVISMLTLGLAAGGSIEESAILGNLAAGVEVGKRGTATVSPEEVLSALDFFARKGI